MLFSGLFLAALVGSHQGPPIAALGDEVTLGYTLFANDKRLDSTEKRPPLVIELGRREFSQGYVLLPLWGLDKALVGLKAGDAKTIEIPSASAFGELAVGDIPPGSDLKMEVKLLRVQKRGSTPAIEIEEIAPGSGAEAKAGDTVDVHYRGTFLNGLQFDSSYDRNTPFSVKLGSGGVIPGFDQGVTGMKVGGKRRVVIPYQLAYGLAGRPPSMPPKSTLVFELEVMAIKER